MFIPRSVERLVEGFCGPKHTMHNRHFGHVPIVERLIEGACVCKHSPHPRHFGHVPIANLAVFVPNSLLPSSASKIILYRPGNNLIRQRRSNEFSTNNKRMNLAANSKTPGDLTSQTSLDIPHPSPGRTRPLIPKGERRRTAF